MNLRVALKETKLHGKPDFPFEVYNTFMPKYFTYFPMHWHDEFEIIYMLEGRLKVNIQGSSYLMEPGDIVVIPPDYIHDMGQVEEEYCHYGNIMFDLSLLEKNKDSEIYKKYILPFLENEYGDFYFKSDSEMAGKIGKLCYELWDFRHEKYSTAELLVKGNLFRIIYELQSVLKKNRFTGDSQNEWIERLKPIFEFIRSNMAKDISVQDAADLCCFSKSHFMKVFKLVTGTSFLDYVKKCRLEYGYFLLLNSEKSVLEVGSECGFSNFSYFIRSFKSVYGLSPLQLRKEIKKKNL